jgi:cAMP-binding proteins - catabolite gene activator and regulatory subunit of cAMP-dependent protein kinases
VILKEGEVSRDIIKIVKGNAEVYVGYGTDRETIVGIIGEQSCFGEFGLLLGQPSIITVVAYSDVLIMRISEDEMDDFISRNHKNIMDIMRSMAKSMLSMRAQVTMLLSELESGKKPTEIDLREKRLLARRAIREYALHGASCC